MKLNCGNQMIYCPSRGAEKILTDIASNFPGERNYNSGTVVKILTTCSPCRHFLESSLCNKEYTCEDCRDARCYGLTILNQVEAIANSKTRIPISSDPRHCSDLIPVHFLTSDSLLLICKSDRNATANQRMADKMRLLQNLEKRLSH